MKNSELFDQVAHYEVSYKAYLNSKDAPKDPRTWRGFVLECKKICADNGLYSIKDIEDYISDSFRCRWN